MKGKALKPFSRVLRRKQTEAENSLWFYLRARCFQGIKFRRQQLVGTHIADFCSLKERLIIEVDGGQHGEDRLKDVERTKALEGEGFNVIRVWDTEVFVNIEGVLEYIRLQILKAPSPRPSPLKGEGEKQKR